MYYMSLLIVCQYYNVPHNINIYIINIVLDYNTIFVFGQEYDIQLNACYVIKIIIS